jgi:glycosyltransferase involved in cell wall biosynthesis
MKRVCIVRRKRYPAQKNVKRNAEALASAGYEVDVICLGEKGDKKRETLKGVNVYRLPLPHHRDSVFWYFVDYAVFFIVTSLMLAWFSLRRRYDVIEVNTMPDFLVFITLFPRLLGSKVILYMFENMPGLFMSSFGKGQSHIGTRVLRWIEKISASYAHRVIVSDGLPYKEVLVGHGIPGDKITVILNVPDDAIFNDEVVSSTNSQDQTHFRLVVVSTIVKRYGIQTLVKALPLLCEQIPELMVDIVGEGEYQSTLEEMASDLGVRDRLNFVGQVPHEDVPSYIARAHVGIAPMIDDVGAPNKLFEYSALARPSIASSLPGLRTVFEDGCFLYFQPDDERDLAAQILDLYRNPEKMVTLSSCAQGFYRKYQWSILKHEYLGVYEELLIGS